VFKGGTSLSKGCALVERFSEDVDSSSHPGKATPLRTANCSCAALPRGSPKTLDVAHTPLIPGPPPKPVHLADHRCMAAILISEPHDAVRRLLERMVTRLGHEPIVARIPGAEDLASAEVFLVEPAAPAGEVLALAASIAHPSLPIVCASVIGPPPELSRLGVVFAASLVKPFTLEQLKDAVDQALLTREAHQNAWHPESPLHENRAAQPREQTGINPGTARKSRRIR
jgi:Nucleotidyl transferase AbiEii toxin, Type IV TA system